MKIFNAFGFFAKKEKQTVSIPASPDSNNIFTVAEEAAVAMALHLFYQDIHDEESYVITINKEAAPYNPWNSKIYGLNNTR